MMFMGGLMVAIAVEHCRLHQRIALKALLSIGNIWNNIDHNENEGFFS